MSDTPETDAQLTTFESISKLKKRFVNKTGTVSAEFARNMERERDEALKLLHEARKLAESAMFEADRYRGALKKIASMDTSQDASPQQCGAVLIAMNALENIKWENIK